MKINQSLLGLIVCFALANNAFAANKTHVTDTLGAGNSRVDISYGISSVNMPGTYAVNGGSSFSIDSKGFTNRLSAAYLFGITDRLDMGIFLPLSENMTTTMEYTVGTNQYTGTSIYEGQGDVVIGAQYLILDKQQDRVSWNMFASFSPSSAPSDDGTTEVKINGVVTTAGKAGKSGNGYTTTTIGSTLSIPAGDMDVYLSGEFKNYGDKTDAGVTYKKGGSSSLSVGVESMVGEKVTLTPYARLNMDAASSYSDGTDVAASNGYDLGILVTSDISKSVSVQVGAEYQVVNDSTVTYSSGDKFSISGNGYGLSLAAMFFF